MDPEQLRKAALDLLIERSSAGSAEIRSRLDDVRRPEFWRAMNPELHIGAARPGAQDTSRLHAGFREQFTRDGYCEAGHVVEPERTTALVHAVGNLLAGGWPPVFGFVYDEFWTTGWDTPVRTVAEALLGSDVRLVPHLAVHHVDAETNTSGWHPHLDGFGRGGRLTTWLALTDATLGNGCIHLVPRRPELQAVLERYDAETLRFADTQVLLQHTRAIPASAGSLLCWGFELLHWGSIASSPGHPRVSVAYEWIAAGVEPGGDERPVLDLADGPPPFADRLRYVARAVETYARFDLTLAPFADLAAELLRE